MKAIHAILLSAGMLAAASAAQAAEADYYIKIEGIDGEAKVASWSFGACNAGQCTSVKSPRDIATGQATGKRQHGPVRVTASQNTQSLRESPSKMSDGKTAAPKGNWDLATGKGARTGGAGGQIAIATGDVDGDGMADLAFAGTQSEISSLSIVYHTIEADWRRVCQGKHFDKVVLRSLSDTFEIADATLTCSEPAGDVAARTIDQTPARLSTNMTTAKQTQGATFGEKVQSGLEASGGVTITFTGGQMKHTKTGHVTLLK